MSASLSSSRSFWLVAFGSFPSSLNVFTINFLCGVLRVLSALPSFMVDKVTFVSLGILWHVRLLIRGFDGKINLCPFGWGVRGENFCLVGLKAEGMNPPCMVL